MFSQLSSAPPKTVNDPFRAISLQVPKEPEPPVCCLKPLSRLEPVEEELLLSFEEWKAKRSSQEQEAAHRPRSTGGANGTSRGSGSEHGAESSSSDSSVPSAAGSSIQEAGDASNVPQDMLPPHFRVPITDRFNYASMDCSARVHTAHRSAKSPHNILSSKKDRYMLSPCAKPDGEKQFVVVELCDDIRIDTVQLANFEFFSGVFKDFTVSVAKTYTTDASEGWTYAGTYRAKNVRGVQSFHPPTSLRDFYRYIRIDFHSHYGNEYYCPMSLLRVYGLTHLEEFKWDIWAQQAEAEAKAKRAAMEEAVAASTQSQELPQPAERPREETVASANVSTSQRQSTPQSTTHESPSTQSTEVSAGPSTVESDTSARTAPDSSNTHSTPIRHEAMESDTEEAGTSLGHHSTDTAGPKETADHPIAAGLRSSTSASLHNTHNTVTNRDTPVQQSAAVPPLDATPTSVGSSSPPANYSGASPETRTSQSNGNGSISNTSSSSTSVPTVVASPSTATVVSLSPVPPASTGGESIYRIIMNRLSALEGNTTLYARYVEEQTAAIREVLRRLGEDVGRLEGIGKAQAQTYQRSMHEFDRYRRKLEIEHGELLSRVNYLADEVVLEKRLGIAQLCLLLAVLVFMSLTRGSRVEGMIDHRAAAMLDGISRSSSMRDWGRRTLSFSGDWVSRFKAKDPAHSTPGLSNSSRKHADGKIQFPSRSTPPQNENIKPSRKAESDRPHKTGGRPHTPTSLRTPGSRYLIHRRPLTPTGNSSPRPLIQRSNSQGTPHGFALVGPVPKSAKRWARTAHLHEVKTPGRTKEQVSDASQDTNGDGGPRTNGMEDDFSRRSNHDRLGVDEAQARVSRMPSPLRISSTEDSPGHDTRQNSETDADAWIDTDMDGSELDVNPGQDVDVFA